MINFRELIKKCPLKIKISFRWEWNHKSKKQLLREEIEELKERIKEFQSQAVKAYIENETLKAEAESDGD